MDVRHETLAQWVAEQVGELSTIAEAEEVRVSYVKPHGALYNRVVDHEEQAAAVLAGSGDLPVLGLPGGMLLRLAEDAAYGSGVLASAVRARTAGPLLPRVRLPGRRTRQAAPATSTS